jgi:hypothetical protein
MHVYFSRKGVKHAKVIYGEDRWFATSVDLESFNNSKISFSNLTL